jgi:hypothetical protein
MKTILVTTGFGYYTDKNDRVVAKARLPKGAHPLAEDYNYIEVADETSLTAIQFVIDPVAEQQRQTEAIISQKARELAITALKAEGKLAADYDDKNSNKT